MKKKIYSIVVLLIILILAYVLWPKTSGPTVVRDASLDVTAITQEVQGGTAVLLDVRTNQELTLDGYAVNSTHFDLTRLQGGELPDYPKDMAIYTYCKGGVRAGKAKEILEENGFTDVTNIGGLTDWIQAGGEVVR